MDPPDLHQSFNSSDGLEDPAEHWRQQFEPDPNHGKRISIRSVTLTWLVPRMLETLRDVAAGVTIQSFKLFLTLGDVSVAVPR